MPRPPKLLFSYYEELQKLLSRLNVFATEPKRPKGRPYDPADIERYLIWYADRESGQKWAKIAKKREPDNPSGTEKVKQGVRRYLSFCRKQGITPDAPIYWALEWKKNSAEQDLLEMIKSRLISF